MNQVYMDASVVDWHLIRREPTWIFFPADMLRAENRWYLETFINEILNEEMYPYQMYDPSEPAGIE